MPIYCFGWYFKEAQAPEFNQVKVDSVLEILPEAPAKVIKAHRKDGHPMILCMLVTSPKIEE